MDTNDNMLNLIVKYSFTVGEAIVRAITLESIVIIIAIIALYQYVKNTERHYKAMLNLDYKKRFQEVHLNFPSNIYESSFDLDILHFEDKEKTLRYMRTYFDLSYEGYSSYKRKQIEKKDWKEIKMNIQNAMTKPAFQDAWFKLNQTRGYQPKFASFIKKFIDKKGKNVKVEPLPSHPILKIEEESI